MRTRSPIVSPPEARVAGEPFRAAGPAPESTAGAPTGFRLVGPEYVAERLADPESARPLIVLEAHFSSIDHPLEPDRPPPRHIPGAIQVHPSYLEAGANREKYYPFYDRPADGNLLPEPALIDALERLGITPKTRVVVYGSEPDGTMAAARLAWGLLYAGVEKVRLLDGGIDAWTNSGSVIDSGIKTVWEVGAGTGHGLRNLTGWRMRPEYLATTAEVREVAEGRKLTRGRLVDVRRRGEWDGTLTDYYNFYSKAGHIPSAIHQGDWDTLLDITSHKLGPMVEAVAERWRAQGIIDAGVEERKTTLIFYCGTGWRSSIAFLVAHLLGYQARNYDDGFYGWSWGDRNRVAIGMEEGSSASGAGASQDSSSLRTGRPSRDCLGTGTFGAP